MVDTQSLQFEKDKVCYEQHCEMFRSLNQLMWQVPTIAMAVTGGLWFGVGTISDIGKIAKVGILLLQFMVNCGLIVVLWRLRYIMGEYLKNLEKFNPDSHVQAKGGTWYSRPHVVITVFSWMLGISGVMSLAGAIILIFGGKI